jgi:Au+-exporting ATPase
MFQGNGRSREVKAILRLRVEHSSVAFVGNGTDDAPALGEADVGLAIGTRTDVAVLMSGSLQVVPNAIALSRATIANIRQCLVWPFAYDMALIPVSAGALYPAYGVLLSPLFAAGAMAFSSVFVFCNARRLRGLIPPSVTHKAGGRT